MKIKKFEATDFARCHPGGRLGRRLQLKVKDLIIPLKNDAILNSNCTMIDVLDQLTSSGYGVVFIKGLKDGEIGLLTDGDIRRLLLKFSDRITTIQPVNYINLDFIFINQNKKAIEALEVMENRSKPLNFLLVVSDDNKIIGIIRLHELYKLLK